MSSKTKIIIANVLIILGHLSMVSGFIMIFVANKEIFGIVTMFVFGFISIVVGGVFWKISNHPVVEVQKTKKPKKTNKRKPKKPIMSDKDWQEQEEEDDEMMFIEEVLEDD